MYFYMFRFSSFTELQFDHILANATSAILIIYAIIYDPFNTLKDIINYPYI